MKGKVIFLLVVLSLFFTLLVSASCDEGQIDINNADSGDLDKLYGIGESKAEAIINSRPFSSLDDLIKVSGIGDFTLQKIKEQGLACVDKTKENEEEISDEEQENEGVIDLNDENYEENKESGLILPENKIITLSSKDIKTNEGSSDKGNNLATYGLTIFCILLAFLFFIKNRRKDGIE